MAWALAVACGVGLVRLASWLDRSRLDAAVRLDQLASLPPDTPLDSLRRAVPWLDCRATIPSDSTPADYRCAGAAGGVTVRAATLDRRLAELHLLRLGWGGPNLHAWARTRYGIPSDSCTREIAGFHATVVWWTRGAQTVSISTARGSPNPLASELWVRSHRLAHGCVDDAGPDVLRLRPPTTDDPHRR